MQIPLLDHVIMGQPRDNMPGHFSFREHGLL
jgi:DNA repair protein RadC